MIHPKILFDENNESGNQGLKNIKQLKYNLILRLPQQTFKFLKDHFVYI
mgnify:CR=1 FL=1